MNRRNRTVPMESAAPLVEQRRELHRPTKGPSGIAAGALAWLWLGCATDSPRGSEHAVEAATLLSLAEVHDARQQVPVAPPRGWPEERAWKPWRYFGPFPLHSPHVRVSGTHARWAFRDEFDGMNAADAADYARYFRPLPLPTADFEPPGGWPPPQRGIAPPLTVPGE